MEILPKSTTGSVSTRLSILKIFNTQKAPGINKLLQREVGGRGEEGQSGEREIFPPSPAPPCFPPLFDPDGAVG